MWVDVRGGWRQGMVWVATKANRQQPVRRVKNMSVV